MVIKKETTICCDFCSKKLAIKTAFRFKPTREYYTIGTQHLGYEHKRKNVHLCGDCYRDMRSYAVDVFGNRRV